MTKRRAGSATDSKWQQKMQAKVDQLKAQGRLPSLEEWHKAMREVRRKYRPKALKATDAKDLEPLQ